MGNGTFEVKTTNRQHNIGTYTAPDGRICGGIHVFTTLGKTRQSLVPLINPSQRVELSSMSPNPAVASAASVIAKINGNVFDYKYACPLGINYEGSNGNLYISGDKYSAPPPDGSFIYTEKKYHPSFCVKKDGTAVIRWFKDATALKNAMDACRCIIGAAHPLVFGGKRVTDGDVYDNEPAPNHMLIYDDINQDNCRFNFNVRKSQPNDAVMRTCLGHRSGNSGIYIMVCTDSSITLHEAADLMRILGCDYAVNLDGSGSVQMRIKNGYGGNGKVTSASGVTLYAGIAACTI